jgi:hypothetical protein
MEQQREASHWAGRVVSPLTTDEAAQMAQVVNSLQAQDKAAYVQAVTRAIGATAMRALSAQIMGAGNQSLGIGGVLSARRTTSGRNVAGIYFAGADALSRGQVKVSDTPELNQRAEAYRRLEGAFASKPELDAAVAATIGVWAGLQALDGDANLDRAIQMATGGVAERNGAKTLLPYGMDDDEFADRIDRVTEADLRAQQGGRANFRIGNRTITARELAMRLPSARLQVTSGGAYTIASGGATVLTESGRPFALSLESLGRPNPPDPADREPEREPSQRQAPRRRDSTAERAWGISR